MKKLKNLLITGLTLGMLSLPKVVVSPVQNVNLDREIFTDKSTSGILYVDQNYNVRPGLTNKFERHFRVQDVKDRKSILFHGYSSYNKKDFLTNENTQGCILVGEKRNGYDSLFVKDNVVLNNLVKKFPEGFNLTIQEKN